MKAHADVMYLEMIAMGIGAFLFIQGDVLTGGAIFLVGAVVHFGLGGFATGF